MKFYVWIAALVVMSCQPYKEQEDAEEYLNTVHSSYCVDREIAYMEETLDSLLTGDNLVPNHSLLTQIQQTASERDYECLFYRCNSLLHDLSFETGNDKSLLRALCARASYHFERRAFDSAYHYYERGFQVASGLTEESEITLFLYPMAVIDYYRNNTDDAEYATLKVLQYESQRKQPKLFEVYSLLGNIKARQKRYTDAAVYHDHAANHARGKRQDFKRAVYFNNIGNVFEQRGELSEALCFYVEGMKLSRAMCDEPILKAALESNAAMVRLKLGEISLSQVVRKLNVWDELQIPVAAAYRQRQLADYHLRAGDTVNARSYALNALRKVDSVADYAQMKETLRFLIPIVPDTEIGKLQKYLNTLAALEDAWIGPKSYAELKMEYEYIVAERERAKNDFSLIGSVASGIVFCTLAFHSFNLRSARRRLLKVQRKKQKLKRALKLLAADVNDQVAFARFEEKERIARDLHDDVMNELASVRMKMSAASLGLAADDSKNLFFEYQQKVQYIERHIRGIAHGLVMSEEVPVSLGESVQNFIEEQRSLHKMCIKCEIDKDFEGIVLPHKIKVDIFNIVKEAFFNSVKYSKGSQIVVRLIRRDTKLKVIIEDDGTGIPVTARRGMGLRNMTQRASEMGGRLNIKQAEPKGTSVELKLNLI